MKSARTIRTLKRCGIPPSLIGFGKRAHLSASRDEYMTMYSLPRTKESARGFRAVQQKFVVEEW